MTMMLDNFLVGRSATVEPDLLDRSNREDGGLYRLIIKRAFDILCVLLATPVVLPLILVLALLVASDGHNPFYSQLRVGRKGKAFRMWKLRSMVPNADQCLQAYLAMHPSAKREWDSTQKLKCDPRITRVGRVLRKLSLDELPQLLNVLNGTMSLVGPRPMMLCQRSFYPGKSYFKLRPGITGLWQISDRNECDFVDRVPYDELYHHVLSFRTDLVVLFRTVAVVMRGTGY